MSAFFAHDHTITLSQQKAIFYNNLMKQLLGSVVLQLIVGALLKAFAPASWGIENYLSWTTYTVIGLFLMVGLQIHLKKFMHDLKLCLLLVLVTTMIPMIMFYYMGIGFDLSVLSALTVSVVLVTTGTGVTIQTLSNLGMLHTRVGQFLTLVSALDDIPATIFMAYLLFSNKSAMAVGEGGFNFYYLAGAVVVFSLAYLFKKQKWPLTIFFLIFAVLAAKMLESYHVSAVMGGLFSGFFLSLVFGKVVDTTEAPMEKLLKPLLPFYMIFIGMKLSPEIFLNARAMLIAVSFIIVGVLSKWLCTYILMRKREDLKPKVISWGMVPRGIPGFAFATAAVAGGLISQEIFTILVLVVSVSTWIGLLGLEVALRQR